MPIAIGALGTITKGLLKGLEDLEIGKWVETIQRQHCKEQPESWDESWRLEETWCYSNSSVKPSVNTDVKNADWMIILCVCVYICVYIYIYIYIYTHTHTHTHTIIIQSAFFFQKLSHDWHRQWCLAVWNF